MATEEKLSIEFYKCLEKGKLVVVSAKFGKDGSLIIEDFDASQSAHDTFGGDLETWLKVDSTNIDELIHKLNNPKKSIFKTLINKQQNGVGLKSRADLLYWMEKEYNGIGAMRELGKLFDEYGITYKKTSWPLGDL